MFRKLLELLISGTGLTLLEREQLARERTSAADLRARLSHERDKVQRLKARLAEASARAEALEAELKTSKSAAQTRFREKKQLHERLRWHWATYPGSERLWQDPAADRDAFTSRARALKAKLVDLMAAPEFAPSDRRVTAVITSCGRHDLLGLTLQTFFNTNTYPLEKAIVVEDGERDCDDQFKARFSEFPIEWMNTGGQVGQIRAIDAAYARVSTPYIFHCEDDYRFLHPGYIEESLAILEAEPLCLQVWIRGAASPGSHPIEEEDRFSGEVRWRRVAKDCKIFWHGFSFNPGLRRLRDYRLIGGSYASIVEPARGEGGRAETQLSELYESVGYFAAALWTRNGQMHAKHRGGRRHIA